MVRIPRWHIKRAEGVQRAAEEDRRGVDLIDQFRACRRGAGAYVAMPICKLGQTVDNDACANLQRLKNIGGAERVVHHIQRANLLCVFCHGLNVDDGYDRIGRDLGEKTRGYSFELPTESFRAS